MGKEIVPTSFHGRDKVIKRSSHQDVKDTKTHTKVTKDTKVVAKETRVTTERLPSGAEVTDRYSRQVAVVTETRTAVTKGRTSSGAEVTATVKVRPPPRLKVIETRTRVTEGHLPSTSKPAAITSGAKVTKPAAKKK